MLVESEVRWAADFGCHVPGARVPGCLGARVPGAGCRVPGCPVPGK